MRFFVMASGPRLSQTIDLLPLVLERIDASKNMARFYALSVEPSLFGDTALVRHWGRLGTRGRHRVELYAYPRDAHVARDAWISRKLKRGYKVRPISK
jgi:predicted DNA-binding WGR domain protein